MTKRPFDTFMLWDSVQKNDGDTVSSSISQWQCDNSHEVEWLGQFPDVVGDVVPRVSDEDLWGLYALSRVADVLISRIGEHHGFLDAYRKFMLGLGLQEVNQGSFHPFFHEVSHVWQVSDPEATVEILGTIWPGFMLGSLMICRAGVSIAAGTRSVQKDVAESSTMYWTYRRSSRPCEDLSAGWGHNSQWRTRFRRDYRTASSFLYNVDGTGEHSDPPLEEHERAELVRHRCFIHCNREHRDMFPYHETYVEPRDSDSNVRST